ncbi:radical SAM protein [Proteiniborus sp.]|uniref:radical SAM protein n=1 Tax=Proteiniborus sp. TaxID=2079015 RepID=UPI00332F406D
MKEYNILTTSIDITYNCPFRCLHCFNSSGTHNFAKKEMTNGEFMNAIKQISEYRPNTVCFCGGEPLLRKDLLIESASYLSENSKHNIDINLVTNGYLMDKKTATRLKDSGFKLIQISLDGATPSTHDWLRNKKGSYHKAIEATQILVDEGFYVGIACAPNKKNIDEIDDLIDLCYELGVKEFRMQPLMKLGRAKNIEDSFLNSEDYWKLCRKLRKKQEQMVLKGMHIEWGDPILHILSGRKGKKHLDYISINAYGDIVISPYLPVIVGNIKKHTLNEYFNNGLGEVWELDFIKVLSRYVKSAETLDINSINNLIPEIFTGRDIEVDLVEDNIILMDRKIIEKYKFEGVI